MKFMKKLMGTILVIAIVAGVGYAAYRNIQNEKANPVLKDGALRPVTGPGGDTYRVHSGVEGTIVAETVEGVETYSISGAWIWNETLTSNPEFESAGGVKIADFPFASAKKTAENSSIYYSGGDGVVLYYFATRMVDVYDSQYGWYDESMRFVDCGAEAKPVSKEFYEWFTANATPADETAYLKLMQAYVYEHGNCQVSGYWKWNNYIEPCAYKDAMNPAGYVHLFIHGTVAGAGEFERWSILPLHDDASQVSLFAVGCESRVGWHGIDDPWLNSSYRYFYLGDEPQTLSSAQYAYFLQNARPCTKEEYEAAEKNFEHTRRGVGYYTGRAEWVSDPSYERIGEDREGAIYADFYSNGEYFSVMRGYWDDENQKQVIQYGTKYNMTTVYTSDDGWMDEAYMVFDVGQDGMRSASGLWFERWLTFEPTGSNQ